MQVLTPRSSNPHYVWQTDLGFVRGVVGRLRNPPEKPSRWRLGVVISEHGHGPTAGDECCKPSDTRTRAADVYRVQQSHPGWTQEMVAKHLGLSNGTVS